MKTLAGYLQTGDLQLRRGRGLKLRRGGDLQLRRGWGAESKKGGGRLKLRIGEEEPEAKKGGRGAETKKGGGLGEA